MKILVVDDNIEFCDNVEDILTLKGFEVTKTYDGVSAIEIVKKSDFDLVIMDIKMPLIDGVEAFKQIKKINPKIAVIMVTAFAVEELIRESLREGAFGLLKKPLDFDKLFTMIEDTKDAGSMIMIVDDDEHLCENMADILTGKGYRVRIANDSDSAISKTKLNNFDIIILDMRLPPLNGFETYRAIRDIRPEVIVLIITGYIGELEEEVNKMIDSSAYTCFEKPIDMEVLLKSLSIIEQQKADGKIEKPKK